MEGVAWLAFSSGGGKESWAEGQQNLKDKACHVGMRVWKEEGEPPLRGTTLGAPCTALGTAGARVASLHPQSPHVAPPEPRSAPVWARPPPLQGVHYAVSPATLYPHNPVLATCGR